MFTVTKNARIAVEKASEKFAVAELTGVPVRESYYVWPFEVPVLGCGDDVPDDYDPDKRNAFKLEEDYTLQTFLSDLSTLADQIDLDVLVQGFNRGVDLQLRSEARPNPKKAMSKDAKQCWVMNNHGETAMEMLRSGATQDDFVAKFNELQ